MTRARTRLRSCLRALAVGASVAGTLTWGLTAGALPGERSFTPSGLRMSVMSIVLRAGTSDTSTEHVLYQCAKAKPEECMVDLTDQGELDGLAATADVPLGSYQRVELRMCAKSTPNTTKIPLYVKGSFDVEQEGKTYFTDATASNASGLKTTGPAEPTRIDNWHCAVKIVVLPKPLVVTADSTVDLSIVVDNEAIAFSSPATAPGTAGCKAPPAGPGIPLQRGLCLGLSSMLAYVGSGEPELRRFVLAHHATKQAEIDDAKANGYVVVIVDPEGMPLMAYARPFHDEGSAAETMDKVVDKTFGGPSFGADTVAQTFTVASDGSIRFETGILFDNAAIFEAFQLKDHFGVLKTRNGGTWQYHAIPYSPAQGAPPDAGADGDAG